MCFLVIQHGGIDVCCEIEPRTGFHHSLPRSIARISQIKGLTRNGWLTSASASYAPLLHTLEVSSFLRFLSGSFIRGSRQIGSSPCIIAYRGPNSQGRRVRHCITTFVAACPISPPSRRLRCTTRQSSNARAWTRCLLQSYMMIDVGFLRSMNNVTCARRL